MYYFVQTSMVLVITNLQLKLLIQLMTRMLSPRICSEG